MNPNRTPHEIGQRSWLRNGTCMVRGCLRRHCCAHALIRRDRPLQETRA
jgi:hypothetical protein